MAFPAILIRNAIVKSILGVYSSYLGDSQFFVVGKLGFLNHENRSTNSQVQTRFDSNEGNVWRYGSSSLIISKYSKNNKFQVAGNTLIVLNIVIANLCLMIPVI